MLAASGAKALRHKLVVVHGGSAPRQYRDLPQAIDAAFTCGADAVELDVRRTADGTLVLHHDEAIADALLSALPFEAAERAAASLGYTLPRLDAVLDRVQGRFGLDLELKECGYEEQVLAALTARGLDSRAFVVTSFELAAIDAVRRADASVQTGLLVWDCTGAEALDAFARSGAAFLGPDHQILDAATLDRAAAEGVRLLPWTVNEPAAMSRLLAAPAVVGLITDRPADALAMRAEKK